MLTPEDMILNISRCTGSELMFRFSLTFFKTQKKFWRKRWTGRWRSNPLYSFEKLSKRRFQKINDCLARIRENVQTASQYYGTVLISASSQALFWFYRRNGSYLVQWKLFLTRHHLGMLSIGSGYWGIVLLSRPRGRWRIGSQEVRPRDGRRIGSRHSA
jgi:hypothetical protein